MMRATVFVTFGISLFFSATLFAESVVYPAPPSAQITNDFTVTVDGKPLELYSVETLHGDSAQFANFDFSGAAQIVIHSRRDATAAKILPESANIHPTIQGNDIQFSLNHPCNLTVEVDGVERVLHLFANPIETARPKSGDANVIYFAPGVHDITHLEISNNSTLYLAGGAILRAQLPDENDSNENFRKPVVEIAGAKNVKICGRGILDLSALPWHARQGIVIKNSENVSVEGITILDSPSWTLAVFNSKKIHIDGIKEICRRVNGDGIDLCNSQDAVVENCFLRDNDDEICVKTTAPAPAPISKNIVVKNCVIWNERARGLGITSETRRDIENVTFTNCDIIHDFSDGGDCAALAVLVSDSGSMRNINFDDIRVHDAKVLFRGWIGSDVWGHDAKRGRIDGLWFKNIEATGDDFPRSDLIGCDTNHLIQNVAFENLRIQGELIHDPGQGKIFTNAYVKNLKFSPAKPTENIAVSAH